MISSQNSGKCSGIPMNCLKCGLSLIAGIKARSYRYYCNTFLLSSIIVDEPLPPPVPLPLAPKSLRFF